MTFFSPRKWKCNWNKYGTLHCKTKRTPRQGGAFTGWCCIRVCSLANMCFLLPNLDSDSSFLPRTVGRLKAVAMILWIMLIHSGSPGCCSPKEVMSWNSHVTWQRYSPVYTTPLSSTDMLILLVPLVVRFRAESCLASVRKTTTM